MPKWFTEDPAVVWDGLDSALERKVLRWIDRAETIVSTKFPTIQARIDAGSLSVEAVAGVVEEMVDRAISRELRGGVTEEQLPEWSVSYESGQGLGQGSVLYLTTDEFALLAPPRVAQGLGSVRMARAYEVTDPTAPTP
ncbi:hypothetical protein [Corynebacterium callunae]|uniref:hypothetical protein n=1 Tax=Corynebacterium callunae TaxID=1721 RepID=UPI001FFECCC8|nr:hypothetical protein [Corynebacterium callunae]MCK2199193.1 hypothetical protein [Corynebacterium callunae]